MRRKRKRKEKGPQSEQRKLARGTVGLESSSSKRITTAKATYKRKEDKIPCQMGILRFCSSILLFRLSFCFESKATFPMLLSQSRRLIQNLRLRSFSSAANELYVDSFEGGIKVLVLNRFEGRNSFSRALLQQVRTGLPGGSGPFRCSF